MVKHMLYCTKQRDGIQSQIQQFPNSILIWLNWEYSALRQDSSSPFFSQGELHFAVPADYA